MSDDVVIQSLSFDGNWPTAMPHTDNIFVTYVHVYIYFLNVIHIIQLCKWHLIFNDSRSSKNN